jgi:hypothetical protein
MRIAATIWCLLSLHVAVGCRHSRSETIEAELRTKERMLRETKEELERARLVNESLEREYLRRQQGLSPGDNSAILSPKDIIIGRGTGGVDDDGIPGDEALQVVVVPRDEDGNPVRAVGTLMVSAWEILPGGVKVPLSSWDVSAMDVRRSWKGGLFASGYFIVLPWKKLPVAERLRVGAQLTLPDGRIYEADKDISIRPLKQLGPPPGQRMPSIISTPELGPVVPETLQTPKQPPALDDPPIPKP